MRSRNSLITLVTALACTSSGNARQATVDTATTRSGPIVTTAAAAAPAQTSAADTAAQALQRKADRSRIAGDSTAKVWLVEVSDFQCPFCARFHDETYKEIQRDYVATGRIRLAYVNFPLPMHEHAWPAAEAALCAGAQGRFWEMHDALFQSQTVWSGRTSVVPLFDTLAKAVGVRQADFQRCMRDRVMQGLVQQDFDRGKESGIRSTPTFFVGDTAIVGAQPVAVFRRVLDNALAKAARGNGSR